jgi:hypothetical protein
MIITQYKTSDGQIFNDLKCAQDHELNMLDTEFDYIADVLQNSNPDFHIITWLHENRKDIERFFTLHDILQ